MVPAGLMMVSFIVKVEGDEVHLANFTINQCLQLGVNFFRLEQSFLSFCSARQTIGQ